MKKIILIFISACSTIAAQLPIERVIIWGHPLHSHTHSYIHWGFYRAFEHLGYETHWVKSINELKNVPLKNSLFLTAGTCDNGIPIRTDCWYILHNCNKEKYQSITSANKAVFMQVYTHDVISQNIEKIDTCVYRSIERKALYMPWATDLLPHEIEENKHRIQKQKSHTINWIGTVWSGKFGNITQINNFKKACAENGISFQVKRHVSTQENKDLIQRSYIAPAIQGKWQCEKGYIPCRIFKNVSYGQMGISNSKIVYDLFEHKIVYNPNCYQLFYDAQKKMQSITTQEIHTIMDLVRDKHTYLNRIKILLDTLEMIHQN